MDEGSLRLDADALDANDPRLAWLLANATAWRRANEKTLVFVAHRETLDMLRDALSARAQLASGVFHEELSAVRRDTEVARFRAADGPSLLVSTEAGGEGRNLQFCRIVVNYDLPWNPMKLEQRIGRVHRLGQQHPVRVINLAARGTIEAYVLEILDRKIRMFELVVGEMEEILGTWQPHGSFEDEIFRRWVDSRTPAARKRRFAELAQNLLVARRLYQTAKEQEGWLYPTVQKEGDD